MSEGKKYGIYCNAALATNPSVGPRYVATGMEQARMFQDKANRECASGCQHPIKPIKKIKP